MNAIADLEHYGVAFVSLKDSVDLSTPSGRLTFQVIGAMAEFKRELIRERVKGGLKTLLLRVGSDAVPKRTEKLIPMSQ